MRGISTFDPGAGEYEIVPSEYQRNLNSFPDLSGSEEGDEPMWHWYDVQRKTGDPVLEIVEDRRGMEGLLDASGRQFLLRPPDEEPLMAFSRQGALIWKTTTLRNTATDEVLGSWKKKTLSRSWEFRDANDEPQLVATRPWSLGGTDSQTYRLESADGSEIGRFTLRTEREVVAYKADITLEPSSVPPEITLALVSGIFRAKRSTKSVGSS